jgi:small-conductance mechanosensitive channel
MAEYLPESFGSILPSLITFGVGVVLAVAVRVLGTRLVRALYRATGLGAGDAPLMRALTSLVSVAVLLLAGYLALEQLRLSDDARRISARLISSGFTAVVTLVAMRLVGLGFDLHIRRTGLRGSTASLITVARKIAQVAILVIGVLLVVDQLHYRVTALIAGVGLASLGVGLALQDTLSNFFAGLWLATDRPVRIGDYIEMESGPQGFVADIGWRHSRLRTWDDSLVIVPNNRLASALVVNNSLPSPDTTVSVSCGVSYESDLEHVEQVCKQIAREVHQRVEGAVADWEPFVLFREFGESNIEFAVGLRVSEPSALRLVRHEFIKAARARFRAEGIEINYPARTLYLRGRQHGEPPEVAVTQTDARA